MLTTKQSSDVVAKWLLNAGMDLLGVCTPPPSPGQGGAIFHDKAKNY